MALAMGDDRSLLIVDDDKPFLTRLSRAMEARGQVTSTRAPCSGAGALAVVTEAPERSSRVLAMKRPRPRPEPSSTLALRDPREVM